MTDKQTGTLAASVASIGDQLQITNGHQMVIELAVVALLRSHPNHPAFAEEFRRLWLQAGSLHSDASLGNKMHEGMRQALEMLEESCSVALGVRPVK